MTIFHCHLDSGLSCWGINFQIPGCMQTQCIRKSSKQIQWLTSITLRFRHEQSLGQHQRKSVTISSCSGEGFQQPQKVVLHHVYDPDSTLLHNTGPTIRRLGIKVNSTTCSNRCVFVACTEFHLCTMFTCMVGGLSIGLSTHSRKGKLSQRPGFYVIILKMKPGVLYDNPFFSIDLK